mmetsp:Transcript_110355/g.356196  ORF Transcript_110355/g.356196 Transcript_110355/m.356196 type:complete len:277 (-) Transcript_110355:1023-1853(-)
MPDIEGPCNPRGPKEHIFRSRLLRCISLSGSFRQAPLDLLDLWDGWAGSPDVGAPILRELGASSGPVPQSAALLQRDGDGGPRKELLRGELCVDAQGHVREGLRALDEAVPPPGRPALDALHGEVLEELHRHDFLLNQRELLADAAARPRGKGHVGGWVRRPLLPPLRHEGGRVGAPGLRVQVQREDVHDDGPPLRDPPPAAERQVLREGHALEAARGRHQAHRLLDAPVQVLELGDVVGLQLAVADHPVDLLDELRLDAWVGHQEHDERGHGGGR